MSFNNQLRARREVLGWSRKEVAALARIDEAIIIRSEQSGHYAASLRLESVERWAKALGLVLSLTPEEQVTEHGLFVNWEQRQIFVDGFPVRLTPMEWKALELFAARPGELVPHFDLFHHLYGKDPPSGRQSTSIRVLITKLRRLLPPLRIVAQWGRGYVVTGINASTLNIDPPPRDNAIARDGKDNSAPMTPSPAKNPAPSSTMSLDRTAFRRKMVEISNAETRPTARAAPPQKPDRADELLSIERFLAERGVTRCPDVATIPHESIPTLVWDKMKRKWVRPASETAA